MTTKGVLAAATVAVAAGIFGFGTARMTDERKSSPRIARRGPGRHVARLERELAVSLGETARLHRQVEELRRALRSNGERPQDEERGAPLGRQDRSSMGSSLEERTRQAAAALSVPKDALQAAIVAEARLRNSRETGAAAAVEGLAAHGENGFRAVVALMRGGRVGHWIVRLLKATYAPGQEALLLETAEMDDVDPKIIWTAIDGLAFADTPQVRSFLVERIRQESNPEVFFRLARTLAALKEDRGAASCESKLLRVDEWAPYTTHIIAQLGGMGGQEARRVLVNFIHDKRLMHTDHLRLALAQLSEIDPEVAKEAALSILESPRERDETALKVLREYGGIPAPPK